jgi:hypothetical protein
MYGLHALVAIDLLKPRQGNENFSTRNLKKTIDKVGYYGDHMAHSVQNAGEEDGCYTDDSVELA